MNGDIPLTIELIGTGTSVGVPVIGCDCPVCRSDDPRNARMRSSAVIRTPGLTLLIDSGPDLRQQALAFRLRAIDGVLYTHGHVDHVAGFDEMRAFCWRRDLPLPLYATAGCMETLQRMFGWAFEASNTAPGYIKPAPRLIDGAFEIESLRITPIPVRHGTVETIGFRFDAPGAAPLAYIPDVKTITSEGKAVLSGVDTLIIDALRKEPHHTHMTIDEALAAIEECGARRGYLTHLSHDIDYGPDSSLLPSHVSFAYDGLKITASTTPS